MDGPAYRFGTGPDRHFASSRAFGHRRDSRREVELGLGLLSSQAHGKRAKGRQQRPGLIIFRRYFGKQRDLDGRRGSDANFRARLRSMTCSSWQALKECFRAGKGKRAIFGDAKSLASVESGLSENSRLPAKA